MKRLISSLLILLALTLAAAVSAQDEDDAEAPPAPPTTDEIVFEQTALQPEGVEYDAARGRFLVGSLNVGTIYTVDEDGTLEAFIEDDAFDSTVGIHIDPATNRLLVAISNRNAFSGGDIDGPVLQIGAFDLETGERLFMTDLTNVADARRQFANDVAVDAEGNAYLTNSFAPVIYRVTPEGDADVFAEDDMLRASPFGLNGIEVHPDGYLLAAVTGSGAIFKVPLEDPEAVSRVELDAIAPIDGMVLTESLELVAVARVDGVQVIARITSEDDWTSAAITETVETSGAATTVAAVGDDAFYYVNAYLNNFTRERYELVRVTFEGTSVPQINAAEAETEEAEGGY